jgi:LmeA-like phospholipid-binding
VITVVVVVLVLLLLLGLAAVVADRVCVELAERRASEYLSEPFGRPPTVRVHGRPFLTQALRGRYRDIEVSGDGLRLGELSGATLTAHIYDAHLPPRELLGGRTTSLPCAHVTGQIVLPYSEVARISRIPGLTFSYEKRRLVATAALPVPGVSQLARVSGEARLTVVGGAVWLRVRGLAVAGISLPSMVLKQLTPSLNVQIPLSTLPFGLRLEELKAEASGLLVCASADDVVFTAAS